MCLCDTQVQPALLAHFGTTFWVNYAGAYFLGHSVHAYADNTRLYLHFHRDDMASWRSAVHVERCPDKMPRDKMPPDKMPLS